MSLQNTPSGERVHIAFLGRRNAGKSSLINAVTGQALSIVSDVAGTTTDPVYKAMELLPLGPVVMIDTPGLDDEGALGAMRVERAKQALRKADIAVLVLDAARGMTAEDTAILAEIKEQGIPYLLVCNKCDAGEASPVEGALCVSAKTGKNITILKEEIARLAQKEPEKKIVADLLSPKDLVVLVIPIDSAAPKGRLILPQQQTMRDILDAGCTVVATKEDGLAETLQALNRKPRLVICDSQVFGAAAAQTPADVLLTSFSILFARYKGDLAAAIRGAKAIDTLQDGDRILIAEGCTHHRQCDDIGTVKLPRWISGHTDKKLELSWCSGTEFPADLSPYGMIIHCGGCMLNQREMQYRLGEAARQQVPITNYGIFIAYVHGILKRSVEPFPDLYNLL